MKVKLTYFKQSGSYYTEGDYEELNPNCSLYMIWDQVRQMMNAGKLPGLVDGADEFIVLVDVPEHPNNHKLLLGI